MSARQIFFAKFNALVLMFAVFVLAMNLPWAVEYCMTTAGQWDLLVFWALDRFTREGALATLRLGPGAGVT